MPKPTFPIKIPPPGLTPGIFGISSVVDSVLPVVEVAVNFNSSGIDPIP